MRQAQGIAVQTALGDGRSHALQLTFLAYSAAQYKGAYDATAVVAERSDARCTPVWRGEEIEENSFHVLRERKLCGNLESNVQSCADCHCRWLSAGRLNLELVLGNSAIEYARS